MYCENSKIEVPVILNTYADDESGIIVNEVQTMDGMHTSTKWKIDLVELVHETIKIYTVPGTTNLTIHGRFTIERLADHLTQAATTARAMLKTSGTDYRKDVDI